MRNESEVRFKLNELEETHKKKNDWSFTEEVGLCAAIGQLRWVLE